MRCHGRKRVYKVNGGYSLQNTGGIEMICPMCLGVGKVEKLETAMQKNEIKISRKRKIKDEQNGDEEKTSS